MSDVGFRLTGLLHRTLQPAAAGRCSRSALLIAAPARAPRLRCHKLASAATAPTIDELQNKIDQARRRGALRKIAVPPCPELLLRLQCAMSASEPDRVEVGRIAHAYTFGLFCHVGMTVLMQRVRGYAGKISEARARIDRGFIATENANHRNDHAVVGALTAPSLPASGDCPRRSWRPSAFTTAWTVLAATPPWPRCTRGWLPASWPIGW